MTSNQKDPEAEILRSRLHSNPGQPTLVYLPGIHGDWTLFTSFRTAAAPHFQILELTYPRTTKWSLADYARAVEKDLARQGISQAWVLAESFGSQVGWELARLQLEKRTSFEMLGLVLAGGFVRYPWPFAVQAMHELMSLLPPFAWRGLFWAYSRYAIFRHRQAPETRTTVAEFLARRTPQDLAAIQQRLALIARNDPTATATKVRCPVFLLAGTIDPIVPSWPVLRWLRANCPGFRGHRILWPADHNVLGTLPDRSLRQIRQWLQDPPSRET